MSTENPTTRILFVRHGTTPTTGRVLPGRAPGLHLSTRGRDEAQRAAERLGALEIAAIYASPLERTMETAAPTAARTGLDVVPEPGLIEGDFGEWTGRELGELAKLPEWRTVQRAPSEFRFPGGESFAEMHDRMRDTVERLRAAHTGGNVVCFSHADPIRICLAWALGGPLDSMQRISVSPCSVSAIAFRGGADGVGDGLAPTVLTVNSSHASLADLAAS